MTAIPAASLTADIEDFLAREQQATAYEAKVQLGRDVLAWARETYGDSLTIASSMGDEILLHLAGTDGPRFRRLLPRHRLSLRRDARDAGRV
ncbi:MAG: hypothetical protein V9G19_07310 [Tetrasphaera sp.]